MFELLLGVSGIGAKSAQRLAFHILNMPEDQVAGLVSPSRFLLVATITSSISPYQVAGLASAITSAKRNVRYCKECYTYTDNELCPVCSSPKRNPAAPL